MAKMISLLEEALIFSFRRYEERRVRTVRLYVQGKALHSSPSRGNCHQARISVCMVPAMTLIERYEALVLLYSSTMKMKRRMPPGILVTLSALSPRGLTLIWIFPVHWRTFLGTSYALPSVSRPRACLGRLPSRVIKYENFLQEQYHHHQYCYCCYYHT